MGKLHNTKNQTSRRKELRNNPTNAEKIFWSYAKQKRLGVKFRRQHGIGPFIVDFYCPELLLVVEIDGDVHFTPESQTYDLKRTDYLSNLNIQVLRLTNDEIEKNIDEVLAKVQKVIIDLKEDPLLSKEGVGGGRK